MTETDRAVLLERLTASRDEMRDEVVYCDCGAMAKGPGGYYYDARPHDADCRSARARRAADALDLVIAVLSEDAPSKAGA
jgi:hypothetical protein